METETSTNHIPANSVQGAVSGSYDLTKDYDDWKKNGNGQRTKIQLGVLALWEILLYEIEEDRKSLFVACNHLEDIVSNCR